MSGVCSSPTLATCETSQVRVPGCFCPPTDWPVSNELKLSWRFACLKSLKKKKDFEINVHDVKEC